MFRNLMCIVMALQGRNHVRLKARRRRQQELVEGLVRSGTVWAK